VLLWIAALTSPAYTRWLSNVIAHAPFHGMMSCLIMLAISLYVCVWGGGLFLDTIR